MCPGVALLHLRARNFYKKIALDLGKRAAFRYGVAKAVLLVAVYSADKKLSFAHALAYLHGNVASDILKSDHLSVSCGDDICRRKAALGSLFGELYLAYLDLCDRADDIHAYPGDVVREYQHSVLKRVYVKRAAARAERESALLKGRQHLALRELLLTVYANVPHYAS